MQAGEFRTPVTFQAQVKTPNGGGGHETEWVRQFDRKAALRPRPQTDNEVSRSGGGLTNQADYQLIVRADDQTKVIRPDWRVMIGGRPLSIQSLGLPLEIDNTISMIVQEGKPS